MRHLNIYSTQEQFDRDGRQAKPFVGYIEEQKAVIYNDVSPASLPFYIDALEALSLRLSHNSAQYSVDGEVWKDMSPGVYTTTFPAGTRIFLRATNPTTYPDYGIGYLNIKAASSQSYVSARCNIGGNLASMAYGEDYLRYDSIPCTLQRLVGSNNVVSAKHLYFPIGKYPRFFEFCKSLEEPPALQATKLLQGCYSNMFCGCTNLVNAPELPATELADSCYAWMFKDCINLVDAPKLPATELADGCYYGMFSGCTSLVNAPELPATDLAADCYHGMFGGCTSLVNAPELPATDLAVDCYNGMFGGCTGLVNAPELPATTLAVRCYYFMFTGCSNLSFVKALFTSTPGGSESMQGGYHWLENVAATGKFVKATGADIESGIHGIPSGWTVEEV